MIDGCHYGTVPGCGTKKVLLKPGAEKLCLSFRFAPRYEITAADLPGGHREYDVECNLSSIVDGTFIGSGVGCCSTMESKYRFRKAEQTCPQCGEIAIIKGKKEYGGGWLCFKAKGGCGAKFKDGDPEIENQEMGRIEHDNPADYYNTVKKNGKETRMIDAVLSSTAASDIFEQDLEEMAENGVPVDRTEHVQAAPPQSKKPTVTRRRKGTRHRAATAIRTAAGTVRRRSGAPDYRKTARQVVCNPEIIRQEQRGFKRVSFKYACA